jgi:hypothetical protein
LRKGPAAKIRELVQSIDALGSDFFGESFARLRVAVHACSNCFDAAADDQLAKLRGFKDALYAQLLESFPAHSDQCDVLHGLLDNSAEDLLIKKVLEECIDLAREMHEATVAYSNLPTRHGCAEGGKDDPGFGGLRCLVRPQANLATRCTAANTKVLDLREPFKRALAQIRATGNMLADAAMDRCATRARSLGEEYAPMACGGSDGASWHADLEEDAPFDLAHKKALESLRKLAPSDYETNAAKLETSIEEAHSIADIRSVPREDFASELKVLDNLRASCVLGLFMAIFDEAANNASRLGCAAKVCARAG